MKIIKKIIFVYVSLKLLQIKKELHFTDLNFKKLDFTNYKQIKSFIFKTDFYKIKHRSVQSFDYLNFTKNLGGKMGINLSKKSIFNWFNLNKNKINFPWNDDLTSRRLINLLYNYEFINSSSTNYESKQLSKIIIYHMNRVIFDYSNKKSSEITSFDMIANLISSLILKKLQKNDIEYLDYVILDQIDKFGMHKSYNILEHAKFLNNLNEIINIFLYFGYKRSKNLEQVLVKMKSTLNEYFHDDGSLPLFNGSNNNYTEIISNSNNQDEYLKSRKYEDGQNGIAFYKDKQKKLFFDVVQPSKDKVYNNLNAGTLSFEFSSFGEKIITNCGASESFGKNPEYLRYSAAHSTIILQNTNISEIKENNPHIKFPQSVKFNLNFENDQTTFEASHNGYLKKFNKVIKRKIIINKNVNKINGEDTIISVKNPNDRIIFHIRFHLTNEMTFNYTNNKKNIILKTKLNNIWIFKCDSEIVVENSIIVDKNTTIPTKQIVIKGVLNNNKISKKWSLEKN